MPGLEQQQAFQFGVFEINPHTRELRKHGVKLKLQDQPLQILLLLLEHPGEIVTREEIQKRLWPENTYVDFDNAINSAIRKLRDALGDSPENPRFIETLARRGYRFIAPVSAVHHSSQGGGKSAVPAGNDSQLHSEPPPTVSQQRYWTAPWILWGGGIFLLLLLGATLWIFGSRRKHESAPVSVVPLTSSLGLELHPCFSPDGNQIAYAWNGPGQDNLDIYVKLIGGGEPLRLTTSPRADISPAWSPNGRQIAFIRLLSQEKLAVMLVPALGGTETKLAEAANFSRSEGNFPIGPNTMPRLLTWSQDGKWLVMSESSIPGGRAGLVAYSIATGKRSELTPISLGSSDLNPSFSPDGRRLAFSRSHAVDVSDIYVLRLSADLRPAEVPRRVTFDNRWTDQPTWSSDGRSLIVVSNRGGTAGLWRVTIDASSPPEPVAFAGDGVAMPVVAPHARRLAYVRSTVDTNIWELTAPEAGQPATSRRQVVASASTENMPQISPDGQKVAFSSSRSGAPEIWVAGIDGSRPVQMTMLGRHSGTPRWSPDGEQIVFDSNASGAFQIYIVSAEGGSPRMLTPGPSENDIPSWSHDGRWIYFCSLRTGRQEIWKIPADGGVPVQVTRDGGYIAFESWDGQWLYYRKAQQVGPIWRMPVAGGAENVVVASAVGRNFAITRNGIYYMRRRRADEMGPALDVYRFDTGKTKTIASFGFNVEAGLAISPDEKRVLYTQIDHQGSNISLAENYR